MLETSEGVFPVKPYHKLIRIYLIHVISTVRTELHRRRDRKKDVRVRRMHKVINAQFSRGAKWIPEEPRKILSATRSATNRRWWNIYKRANPVGYIAGTASTGLGTKRQRFGPGSSSISSPRNLIGPNGASTSIINRVQNINDTVAVFQKLN